MKNLRRFDPSPRTIRRALTKEEIKRLLTYCRPERRLLYETAVFTGLRRGELANLRVRHLDLKNRGLVLDADWTKNRKAGFQPLPTGLLNRLAESAKGKEPDAPLLDVPNWTASVLRVDLKRAGIPEKAPGGKVDFHSLRVSYINLILDSGASLKEAMDLARHLSPNMTLAIYGRPRWDKKFEIVQKIGEELSPQDFQEEYITRPYPKFAVLENSKESSAYRVVPAGFEPALPD